VLSYTHTAVAASPHEVTPTQLLLSAPPGAPRAPLSPGVVLPLTRGRVAARPLSSFSTMIGDRTARSRCVVLRSPGCQVLLKGRVVSVCFKCFRCFQRFVASVSDRCCKSRLECCICCNGYTCMLQRYVINVSSMFLDVCCKCVLSRCCVYFI
jgi:hypothetical protein